MKTKTTYDELTNFVLSSIRSSHVEFLISSAFNTNPVSISGHPVGSWVPALRKSAAGIDESTFTVGLAVCPPTYRTMCLSINLSLRMCAHLSIYLKTYLSVYLSIYLFAYLPVYASIYLSTYLSTYLSIHPFVHPSFWQRLKNIGLVTGPGLRQGL